MKVSFPGKFSKVSFSIEVVFNLVVGPYEPISSWLVVAKKKWKQL
jgi:hypothetical protein